MSSNDHKAMLAHTEETDDEARTRMMREKFLHQKARGFVDWKDTDSFYGRFESHKRPRCLPEEMKDLTSEIPSVNLLPEEDTTSRRPGARSRRLAAEALQALFALHFESEVEFDQRYAMALCSEVCTGLGVDCVADLALVDEEMLEELPTYLKTQLTLPWREKFLKMCQSS